MKAKRLRRHIKLFLADHLWIILLFLAAPVGLPIFYLAAVEQADVGAWLYYGGLGHYPKFCVNLLSGVE